MKKNLIVLILLVYASTFSFAQANSEYSKSLKKMFEVSGTEESYKAAIKQMVGMFKTQYAEVDKATWDELEKEFLKTSLNDLVDMLIPVYMKYLTLDDIKALITFYQTPVGQKYAKNTPLIMQESMEVGQQWGMQIGQKLQEKMEKKGK